MSMTFMYVFSALLALGQCEHSARDTNLVLDKIEEVLGKYPESDEFIAGASLALQENEKHLDVLLRFINKNEQFERYVLKIVEKELKLVSDTSLDDYINRHAVAIYTKYDWYQQVKSRFAHSIKRSSFASLMPTAETATAVATQVVTEAAGDPVTRDTALKFLKGTTLKGKEGLLLAKKLVDHGMTTFKETITGPDGVTTHIYSLTEKAQGTLKALESARILKIAGTILTVGYLGYDIFINVRQWYEGKIDGITASKNIASTFATTTAGILIGSFLGSVAGPGGVLVGATVAGSTASEFVHSVFDTFFETNVERGLAKSYAILGLSKTATQEQIRASYLKLAKEHHPDHQASDSKKEKSSDKFIEINLAYEMIRAERFSIKSSSPQTEL